MRFSRIKDLLSVSAVFILLVIWLSSCQIFRQKNPMTPPLYGKVPPPPDWHLNGNEQAVRRMASAQQAQKSQVFDWGVEVARLFQISRNSELPQEFIRLYKHINESQKLGIGGNSVRAEEIFYKYILSLDDIRAHSDTLLQLFDQKLAKSVSVQNDTFLREHPLEISEYSDLVRSWMIKDRFIGQVIYLFDQFLEIEINAAGAPEGAAAKAMLDQIRSQWSEKSIRFPNTVWHQTDLGLNLKKLAYQDLLRELDKALEAAYGEEMPANVKALLQTAEKQTIENPVQLIKAVRESKRQTLSKLKGAGKAPPPAYWLREAYAQLSDFKPDLDWAAERSPQAQSLICPDPGPSGFVSGNQFPKGVWTMTLDDGPHSVHSRAISQSLLKDGLGNFFWLSKLVPQFREIVSGVKTEGHVLANHSATHANLPKVSQQQLKLEIVDSTEILEKAYGEEVKYFRCPYGACGGQNSIIRKMIADQGMVHLFWNIDSLDWKDKDPESIYQRVMNQYKTLAPKSGGVILFHDIHSQSVTAVARIKKAFAEEGIQFKPLPSVIRSLNEGRACPNGWTP